jgi:hypothetical protein
MKTINIISVLLILTGAVYAQVQVEYLGVGDSVGIQFSRALEDSLHDVTVRMTILVWSLPVPDCGYIGFALAWVSGTYKKYRYLSHALLLVEEGAEFGNMVRRYELLTKELIRINPEFFKLKEL